MTMEKDDFFQETKESSSVKPQFQVGIPVYIEMVQKRKRVRTQVSIVGWFKTNFLFTTQPSDSRLLVTSLHTELIVRYLLDGTVYGFITKLIHKQNIPFGMWVLDYPEVVEVKNLRRSPRIPLYLTVTTDEGREWEMLDLSSHGAAMATTDEPFMGEMVELSFVLPDGNKIEGLNAQIVRMSSSSEERLIGVQFDEDDYENITKIKRYISRCMERQRLSFDTK